MTDNNEWYGKSAAKEDDEISCKLESVVDTERQVLGKLLHN